MAYDVTLITGDGVGPELAEAARKCVDATGVKINWDVQEAGVDVMERNGGNPLPESVLESVRKNRIALKAPITTPVGTGFRSLNVHLRQELDLFACVRPCKYYPGVRSFFSSVPVDLVIFRENTEDLYAGIEFEKGSDATKALIDEVNRLATGRKIATGYEETGVSIKPISVSRSDRLVRSAFEYARENGRKKVTAVHKANIMKHSDGLWLDTARKVAQDFPEIEFEDRIVDNMCMQLVQKPELYDVVGIGAPYGVSLPVREERLQTLAAPVAVRFSRLEGKHASAELLEGRITALSEREAALETDTALGLYENLKLAAGGELYAKVVGLEGGSARIHFTAKPRGFSAWLREAGYTEETT